MLRHYCILRNDLSKGVAIAQAIHAAGESSPGNLPEGTIAVALEARDESELEKIECTLIERNIPHKAIREPDLDDLFMAIGVFPTSDPEVWKIFSNLPLVKEKGV